MVDYEATSSFSLSLTGSPRLSWAKTSPTPRSVGPPSQCCGNGVMLIGSQLEVLDQNQLLGFEGPGTERLLILLLTQNIRTKNDARSVPVMCV